MSLWLVHLAKYYLDSKLLWSIFCWEGKDSGGKRWDCKAACQLSCYEDARQRKQPGKCIKLSSPQSWFIASVISPLLFVPIWRTPGTIFTCKKKKMLLSVDKYMQTCCNYFIYLGNENRMTI